MAATTASETLQAETRRRRPRAAKPQDTASKTALVLGGGAPNMPLMAGALAAIHERNVTFDVVSTSGAGSLAGLLWLAPKGIPADQALRSVTTMSVADAIYRWLPVNYKVFFKPGPFADVWRTALAANPFLKIDPQEYANSPAYAVLADAMLLWAATLTPSLPQMNDWGLCAPLPFIEHVIDFDQIPKIAPHFYLNAYNITRRKIVEFEKNGITPRHFRAALAFPFIYGPYELDGELYYEGAVVDCLNFKGLMKNHPNLNTIVVFDVLGSKKLIRKPRNLYDSWVLSMIVPLVSTAEDDIEIFALKYNHGWRKSKGATADLLKIKFEVPDDFLDEVLDWSASNARRLFDLGYRAGLDFVDEHAGALGRRAGAA